MENLHLQPECVFDFFMQICKIPHGSKNEAQISAFLQNFGKELGYETIADTVGNVLIKKPAYPGFEDRRTIILQSHMDMVCDKRPDVEHDFTKDPIRPYVDGEWLKATGTTLGADNGIGVAAAMAVLADKSLKHGPVNCLFTIDEETGLTGAEALSPELLQGDILVNLDSEDEGEMFIGCAGGVCNYAEFKHFWTRISGDMFYMKVDINNLTGGHSGDDINKGRANANKLLNRFLCRIADKYEFYLCDISGGSLHNAIPRDASAVFAVQGADKESVRVDFNLFAAEVQDEYSATEPDMRFTLQSTEPVSRAIEPETTKRHRICAAHMDCTSGGRDGIAEIELTACHLRRIKPCALHPDIQSLPVLQLEITRLGAAETPTVEIQHVVVVRICAHYVNTLGADNSALFQIDGRSTTIRTDILTAADGCIRNGQLRLGFPP